MRNLRKKSRKHVSFCDSVQVKEFSPERNIGDGQIKTAVLDGVSKPRIRKRKLREVHDQEGEVMGKKICLIGNSEPPDEIMNVTSDKSSGNDDKKASFCVIKGKKYESFDDHTFFGDTGTSHVMDTDSDGLYDAVPIRERIGGYGGEPRLATWKGKKDYRVPQSDGTSTILK